MAAQAELIFVAVPDSAIGAVARALAAGDLSQHAVVHTSGATPVSILAAAESMGAQIGGLHPIWPVATGERPFPAGVVFGIETGSARLGQTLRELITVSGGTALILPAALDRVLYHAATVILSNYMVTLYAEAESLWRAIRIESPAANSAFLGLAQPTLDNLAHQPPAQALTGPIARGDVQTVGAHLARLEAAAPDLVAGYKALGLVTLDRLAASNLNDEVIQQLREGLTDHAHNDS